jgi:hypothetical protein
VKYGRLLLSKWQRMTEKSAISFMTTLVPFLVLRNSKLPFNKTFSCLYNFIRFTWEVNKTGGRLPAWLDGAWCCWLSVMSSALSPWSVSILIDLSGAKKFRVGISTAIGSCSLLGFFVGVVCRCPFLLLCSRNSSADGGVVIVVLDYSSLEALSLRTAVK